jgi:eukaryotic-like serine/threonine-protein kinase
VANAQGGRLVLQQHRALRPTTLQNSAPFRRHQTLPASLGQNPLVRPSAKDWTGQTLYGKWKVERLIGVGGTAAVLQARHRNGRRAALKVLHPHLASHERTRERFLREGRLANLVSHPGVVAVLDDFMTDEGSAVLVMELVEGQTLAAMAKEAGGSLDATEVVAAACAVLDILATAHDVNVIHRDIKPENILLSSTGTHKLADFGLAALGHELGMLTGTNAALGTPAYMSPEQARGDSLQMDARTDIWGLGATMFTLLTGRYLHASSAPKNLVVAAATEQVPSVASIAPDMYAPLSRIVDRAVRTNKEERWPNARAMLAELRALEVPTGGPRPAVLGPVGATTTAPSSLAPHRNMRARTTRAGLVSKHWLVGAVLVATVSAGFVWPRSTVTPKPVEAIHSTPGEAPRGAAPEDRPVHSLPPPRREADPPAQRSATPPRVPATKPHVLAKARARPAPLPAESSLAPPRPPLIDEDLSVPDHVLDRRD